MLYIFHPQSLRDSPGGALGSGLPIPLASLRTACAFLSPPVPSGQPRWGIGERSPHTTCVATHCVRFPFTPSPFGTAPVGHWGAVSPYHLRRYALRALSFHPQSLRDSPGGALGSGLPKPLASLRTACAFFSPPVPSGQPRWGIGERSPQTPCVATLRSPLKFFLYYGEKVLCEERQTKKDSATIHPDRARSVGCGIFFV